MFGFLIKKNFCDGWDNLVSLLVTNIIMLLVTFGFVVLVASCAHYPVFFTLFFLLGCIALSILGFAYGDTAAEIADFKGIRISDYFKAIPGVLKDASLFGLMVGLIICISFFSIDYYVTQSNSAFGFFLAAIVMWLDVFMFLALQWFLPIRSLMHNNFLKCLKKCFIIFFDNTGFTIAVAFYDLVLLAFSVVLIGFLPSFAGLILARVNALRLRLYKYDYLEEHPELDTRAKQKKIPWEELIYEDRETLGPRKFKSFIFPWKDN